MSIEQKNYLGGYLELPLVSLNKSWWDFCNDLKISIDEFTFIEEPCILLSNYTKMNHTNSEHIVILDTEKINEIRVEFDILHEDSIDKLNKYFKIDIPVKVGYYSYWR